MQRKKEVQRAQKLKDSRLGELQEQKPLLNLSESRAHSSAPSTGSSSGSC